jgi:hypothetical protein
MSSMHETQGCSGLHRMEVFESARIGECVQYDEPQTGMLLEAVVNEIRPMKPVPPVMRIPCIGVLSKVLSSGKALRLAEALRAGILGGYQGLLAPRNRPRHVQVRVVPED